MANADGDIIERSDSGADAPARDNLSVVLARSGRPEALEIRDMPRPQAVDDEVVVRVAAGRHLIRNICAAMSC